MKHLLGNSRARRREVEPALERALCHRRVGEEIARVARLRLDECHQLPVRLERHRATFGAARRERDGELSFIVRDDAAGQFAA
ncbi:hypothetical protein [Microbacterium sp.]|uniref:hypothetical protein n=1 Tax=Microbacterium sp. TaxID=51671 RepID=UPI003221452A